MRRLRVDRDAEGSDRGNLNVLGNRASEPQPPRALAGSEHVIFGGPVASRTGGKLNEVLTSLSETMRESTALKGEVRGLAAHGKLTGMVLTMLPLIIAAIMTVVNLGYLAVLVHFPSGKYLIAAAIACLIAGHFVIRRLVDIRV